MPNDSALAEAKYPPSPGFASNATFGAPPPAGWPATPNVFNATSVAGATGGQVTSSVSDLTFDPAGIPVVEAANIEATNTVTVAASTVTATARSIVRGVTIAGILDIEQMTGDSSSISDGVQGTPSSGLQIGQVTVEGIPAYIDASGVHVDTAAAPAAGVTPAEAQSTLNGTLAQDGIAVRLADPTTTTTGPDGHADAGGLVVSFTHAFDIPYVPALPALPSLPDLGSVGIPAGIYTVTPVAWARAPSAPSGRSARGWDRRRRASPHPRASGPRDRGRCRPGRRPRPCCPQRGHCSTNCPSASPPRWDGSSPGWSCVCS